MIFVQTFCLQEIGAFQQKVGEKFGEIFKRNSEYILAQCVLLVFKLVSIKL